MARTRRLVGKKGTEAPKARKQGRPKSRPSIAVPQAAATPNESVVCAGIATSHGKENDSSLQLSNTNLSTTENAVVVPASTPIAPVVGTAPTTAIVPATITPVAPSVPVAPPAFDANSFFTAMMSAMVAAQQQQPTQNISAALNELQESNAANLGEKGRQKVVALGNSKGYIKSQSRVVTMVSKSKLILHACL